MTSYLQQQIKDRMLARDLTTYALEKKAGLNKSAVRNIIQGLSKNPSVTTLNAIALALDCDIADLIGSNESPKIQNQKAIKSRSSLNKKGSYMWNETLYLEAVKIVSELAGHKKLTLNLDQITPLINECYKYSIGKNSTYIDKDFCSWLIDKQL